MYKVFINDIPLFIHNNNIFNALENNAVELSSPNEMTPEWLHRRTAEGDILAAAYNCSEPVETYWKEWAAQFKNIEAAGGLVLRNDGHFLGMFRLEKWDLPKGKAEADESIETTAIREVEEECGIFGLSVEKKLLNTYHTYPLGKKYVLKRTHWYLMRWDGSGEMTPQTDEGIKELRWFSPAEADEFCAQTYGSVAEVVRRGLSESASKT